MGFLDSLCCFVRNFKKTSPDTTKTVLTDMDQIALYTETQGACCRKRVDFDIHTTCFAGLPSAGVMLEAARGHMQRFAHGLARGLKHVAIHVVHSPAPHQGDVDPLQHHSVLEELAAIFESKKLKTLRLVGVRSILEHAPARMSLRRLTTLILDGVAIDSDRSVNALTELIQSCKLKTLVVTNTPQTSGRLADVIDSCVRSKHLKKLKKLDISNNGLDRQSTTMVMRGVLSSCSKLDQLYLQGNTGPDMSVIPRSNLTVIEVSHVGFECVEQLVQAAAVERSLPRLENIIVRHLTLEGPMGWANFDNFCAALAAGGNLRKVIIIPEGSFWRLAYHDLEFDRSRMGPQEYFWNEAVPWIRRLGECLNTNRRNGSLTRFYLAGVTDFKVFHRHNHQIAQRIKEFAPRVKELKPTMEELGLTNEDLALMARIDLA
ncbi:hypothetical protein EC968_004087 [Mortierella alpina]|nr:hypothetical protein EC968_004087 [Mortierella alpina]